ncbi:MAG: tetratricopeptide repeat protein [Acidobacteriia bacterium]|nr:tetratricopeptide repeat protein [Terriglobia bacterium]
MIAFLGFMLGTALAPGAAPETARELSDRAEQLYTQARYAEAEPLFRQALEAWDGLGPEAAQDRAIERRNLGALLRATGRYQEAEPLLAESLRELEATRAEPMQVERALFNLAALYRAEGDLSKAESFALRAGGLVEKRADIPDPERQGPPLMLASIYLEERRFTDAEALLNSALKAADGAIAVAAYDGLATVEIARDNFAQAEAFAQQALYFARLALPAGHPAMAATWNNLAQACRFQGKYMEAEKDYRLAIGVWEDSLGPSHPHVAEGLMNLAAFYHERGREAGAEDLYDRAAGILDRTFGKNDPRTLAARNELAEVLRAERRYTESEKLGRATLAALEKALRPDDPRVLRARSNYARLQASKTMVGRAPRSGPGGHRGPLAGLFANR